MNSAEITKLLSDLNLKPNDIADEDLAGAIKLLLQLIEELHGENEKLKEEIQYLKKRLKDEEGDSDNDTDDKKNARKDHSSEEERKKRTAPRENKKRELKKDKISIDRTERCEIDKSILPEDAEFKGYEEITVQEITIKTDNVLYMREVYYSKSENKTYIADLPDGVRGEYGPGIRSLVPILKHVCNMSEPKIVEFFTNFEICISQPTISRMLTKSPEIENLHEEKEEIFKAGLNSSKTHGIDATGSIVKGRNHHVQIICNPYYAAFFTCEHKDRLSIIDIFLCGNTRRYYFNQEAFDLLETFNVSQKKVSIIREQAFNRILDEEQLQLMLKVVFPAPDKCKNLCSRIMEAGAIAYYHYQAEAPVIQNLICDNAPEYKRITENTGLCWIHDGRGYKKLNPVVPLHRRELDLFMNCYWDYYRSLLDYKNDPAPFKAEILSLEFDNLFSTQTNYPALNDRIQKTKAKKAEMLLVLSYPEIELHNNASELEARAQARKRDVSLHTISKEGTKSQDTYLTVIRTAKKLGVNIYDYIFDRVTGKFELPSLASLIPHLPCPNTS